MGDVRMVRSIMTEMGIKKTPDRSLIEVEGKFYEFLVADGSHPQSEEIYRVLNEIFLLSKLEDSVPDTAQFMNLNVYCDAFLTN